MGQANNTLHSGFGSGLLEILIPLMAQLMNEGILFLWAFFAVMDFSAMREYLREPVRATADEVMQDAVVYQNPGAIMLLKVLLEMRCNRRTRLSVATVTHLFSQNPGRKLMATLVRQLWNFYRMSLTN